MKSLLIAVAAAGSLMVAGAATAQSGADLAKAKCATCHDATAKKVGPSFADISTKLKGKADAEKNIVMALKEGKGHPKIAASDAELATLAKFALAGGK
jgi:cytochrome c551/c552